MIIKSSRYASKSVAVSQPVVVEEDKVIVTTSKKKGKKNIVIDENPVMEVIEEEKIDLGEWLKEDN